jgi:hypothetical protein
MKLYGSEILELYLLLYPDEQRYMGEAMIPGEDEPQVIMGGEAALRWSRWMVANGYITQEQQQIMEDLAEGVRKQLAKESSDSSQAGRILP